MEDANQQAGAFLDGPRPARPDEVPAVVDLVNQVFCVATGRPPTMGEQFPQLLSPENASNLFIFTENGRPVSHVGLWMGAVRIYGTRIPTASMGSVCTLPEARSRGLAGRLVQMAFDRARDTGRPLIFISGDRDLYVRQGAHPAGRFRDIHLNLPGPGNPAPPRETGGTALPVTLRPARLPEEAPLLAALHQAEPVRWERGLDQWPVLATAAGFATILRLRQEFWLAEVGGRPAACWVTGRGPTMPGELRVLEFFGSRPALAASLPHLARATGAGTLHLPVLEEDPLLHALRATGWDSEAAAPEPLPGTVAITDWPLLWGLLAPVLEERLPGSWARARAYVEAPSPPAPGRRYGLEAAGGERWQVEGEEALVRACFGAGSRPAGDLIPPDHPLAQALPLPLPWPKGLNYI